MKLLIKVLLVFGLAGSLAGCAGSPPADTELQQSVKDNRLDLVRGLLEGGADANDAGESGYPPLFLVKSARIAKLLVAHGANVNENRGTEKNSTPTFWRRKKK